MRLINLVLGVLILASIALAACTSQPPAETTQPVDNTQTEQNVDVSADPTVAELDEELSSDELNEVNSDLNDLTLE